ncbi:alpha/beta hydrolase [Martelella soudanensis]|uniref:alpha/beta hydrolase n=1 Tax=unclassified Martelella TaxID=2629616 RepID=UPI0015E035D1|nr:MULTISPECIES: alpha/beta hydrolase [unclassified Martelella]
MTDDTYQAFTRAGTAGEPLVFSFHGTGGNEHQFVPLVEQILPGAAIVSPRGDVSEFGALRFFRRTGEGVYDMDDLARRTDKMRRFIAAHRKADPSRTVYGIGYSNGANILASVLFRQPDLFDRAVLMHPLIPWTPEDNPALSGKDILVTAGERDPICPPAGTRALIGYFEAQKAMVRSLFHGGGHEIRPQEIDAVAEFLKN